MAIEIFCCYAHEDEPLLNKLKAQFSVLEREGLIKLWYDRDISAGTEWEQEIDEHLNAADIILLLVSPDFMNSNYCFSIEMKRALERHNDDRDKACVIPIILRPVDWHGAPFAKLQVLPTDAKPITSRRDRDAAFLNVEQAILKDILQMNTRIIDPPHCRVFPPRRRGIWIVFITLLIAVVVTSGLVHEFWPGSQPVPPPVVVGQAIFTSSGTTQGTNNMGINDTFQVNLSNIPSPLAGNNYYAWLLPDQNQEASSRALGPLMITHGTASLLSPYVDPQHNNLLIYFSGFLVTEEPESPVPQNFSLDKGKWRYYAEIPQSPPVDCLTANINQLNDLCHLRHLLSSDPTLLKVNLTGGLNYWFLNNVKEIQKWSREIVDSNDPVSIRHKLVDILYTLDGINCKAQDIPPTKENTPDDGTLTKVAAIPMLDCSLTQNVSGYLTHIHNHLNAIVRSPGVLQRQVTLANSISTEFNTINAWLKQMQQDARRLVAMDDSHLVLPEGNQLRSEMDTLAGQVLNGSIDPNTGTDVKGVVSIAADIERLATMDVTRY
jgi:TIR domain